MKNIIKKKLLFSIFYLNNKTYFINIDKNLKIVNFFNRAYIIILKIKGAILDK